MENNRYKKGSEIQNPMYGDEIVQNMEENEKKVEILQILFVKSKHLLKKVL